MEPFSTSFLLNYRLEIAPPNVTLQSPISMVYNESNVTVAFSADKAVNWAGYSLNGAPNVTMIDNSATIANLTNGAYDLTVYVNDTFGVSASRTVNFTVAVPTAKLPAEATFSTQLVAVVSVVVVVVVVGAGLLVYSKKHKL